ncbi:molybdopterin converting factor small subunit [Lewinella aquimaris]|uniref:Molybdopterin synthase sulfur carrier subunit n=1 Tax=Neolewinella aquimaris TaxID=1835722 RepID=A0A840E2S5_9BACT|nr:MoaD/ThiS family protein [Neolewinella aquimaris]MBB4078263.1 molybdopterin converting factor small subunit [Neolewinella aquimaris]
MRILCFGIAREIAGGPGLQLDGIVGKSVRELRMALMREFPGFADLTDFAVARNEVYATDEEIIAAGDEVVIIPPVSGG